MLIQVLGTGCAKCTKLAAQAEEAAKKTGVAYTLEKVTDINRIMTFGVMVTPALVIDGKVRCSGSVPSVEQIVTMLTQ
jgi:small redox-active disulfide protein 2